MADNVEEARLLAGPELYQTGQYWARRAAAWTERTIEVEGVDSPHEQAFGRIAEACAATAQAFFAGAQVALLAHMHADGMQAPLAGCREQWQTLTGAPARDGA